MDLATNLPVKIDVFEVKDITNVLTKDDIKIEIKYSYPDSFKMDDLSPASYDRLANSILQKEYEAVNFNS